MFYLSRGGPVVFLLSGRVVTITFLITGQDVVAHLYSCSIVCFLLIIPVLCGITFFFIKGGDVVILLISRVVSIT